VNYYEHHIGDFDQATAHLTACEDGIYSRLLRKCYSTEKPLPSDLPALQRLVRARTREEKAAVQAMLNEFFELQEDGWHQKRCDEEIVRYQDKRTKAKRSAEARWGAHQPQSEGNANAYADGMRTHCEGNALQTPDSSHQSPSLSRTDRGDSPSPSGDEPPMLPDDPNPGPGIPPCDHQAVLALWRQHMPTNPQPAKWTQTRAKHLQARWRELFAEGKATDRDTALAWFAKFFRYLAQSRFLTGRVPPREPNRPPFLAELPWVLSPENFVQCIEGKYHPEN
jgi:uncharacterized protein YdaU (DUF1376 family)